MTVCNCFISYSQDSNEHCEWVKKLATDLRHHGVDVVLDQWDLTLGKDLRFFMEQGLTESSIVLCVCSDNYVKKVNDGNGGAGYEGMIMTQSLLQNCNQDFVIPIIRNNSGLYKVPYCFGSKLYLDFSNDSDYFVNYKKLLEHIYHQDTLKKPKLGKNPFDSNLSEEIKIIKKINETKYINPAMDGHVIFEYDNNDKYFQIGTGEYSFNTRWSGCCKDGIYAYGNIGINRNFSDYPQINDIQKFDFSSHSRTIYKDEIVIFENNNGHFAAIKLGKVTSISHGDSVNIMEFDYHIYNYEN